MSEQKAISVRPLIVTTAVQLLVTSLAIGFLRAIFQLAQRTSGTTLLFASLIVISFFGILFLVVVKISAGRNWARITLLVLLLIGLPFAIPGYLYEVRNNVVSGSLGLIITLLQLIGTYLLFTKRSRLWFRASK